ncbi:Ldh family oxidoreductase [Streptomyces decoyicus]|uniref:Ldh family oxidoreductase n=1 Tax=Streptomyces decoyicus TaxID=249567 RepID=A0ABZ1FD04_9ACTN|nr:Ldh family oxidoreductase [Streptomyces decoyicus]WSB68251.1 Ldh family oxidoreductase [Streptomyces decoyicus]
MTEDNGFRIGSEALWELARDTLTDVGVPADTASLVAGILVDADVRGHPSHGVAMLPVYVQRVLEGGILTHATPTWKHLSETAGLVLGHGGFGQLAATMAAEHCAESAHDHGMAVVGVRGNNHIGMLAAYRRQFTERDVIGLILNVSGPSVSAPGAQFPTLGNDAICLVVPRRTGDPFIVDFATGVVACGKIREAALRGEAVSTEWLLDNTGHPSADPKDLDRGGSVPVFGGYKGLGVQLIIEVLAGVLAGGTVSPLVNRQRQRPDLPMNCSQLFVGFRTSLLGDTDPDALLHTLDLAIAMGYKNSPPDCYFPEQRERLHTARALESGIDIPKALADRLGWARRA